MVYLHSIIRSENQLLKIFLCAHSLVQMKTAHQNTIGSEINLWAYKGIEPTSQNSPISQCRTPISQYIPYFIDLTKISYGYWLIRKFRKLKIESPMEKLSRAIQSIVIIGIHNIQSQINLLHLGLNTFLLLSRHPQLLLRHQRLKQPTSLSTQLIMTCIVSTCLAWK